MLQKLDLDKFGGDLELSGKIRRQLFDNIWLPLKHRILLVVLSPIRKQARENVD